MFLMLRKKSAETYKPNFCIKIEHDILQGTPQWILINFEEEVDLSEIEIEFQGGFAGKQCSLEAGSDSKNLSVVEDFFPEDTNTGQRFRLSETKKAKVFKLVFHNSTDFFGRIVIYRLSFHS